MTAARHALGEGLRAARRAPLVQLACVLTIAVSLLLVGVVRLASANVGRLAAGWSRGVQMVVYLDDTVGPTRAGAIADALGQVPGVRHTRVVAGVEAFARLHQSLGERAGVLDGVDATMMPSSIEVSFDREASGSALDALRHDGSALERIRRVPGVEDVELMGDWIDKVAAVERLLRVAGIALGGLVAFALLFFVAATIRLGVFARRDEIAILKLCGATDGFVKAPFLVEGMLQGVTGAATALAALYALYLVVRPAAEGALGAMLASTPLRFLAPVELLAALPFGAALGLLGSWLAVGRYVEV